MTILAKTLDLEKEALQLACIELIFRSSALILFPAGRGSDKMWPDS